MKLIRLHINNFGTLSNFDYTFNDGLNTICEKNSFGKSTLGAFIKVMFFGFENESAKLKDNRERFKYKPWQGGAYGGTIDFEVKGKKYSMDRSFSNKQSEDIFTLRELDTMKMSKDFSEENIGKEIFSVDSGSFARTMFISQNYYDYGDTDDIDAKIGNLVDNTDDINNFESTSERLKNKINELNSTRIGKIKQTQEEIDDLKKHVYLKESVELSINEKRRLIDSLKAKADNYTSQIEELGNSINELSRCQQMAKDKTEYEGILGSYNHFSKIHNDEYMFFNRTIPNEKELEEKLKKADELTSFEATIRNNKLTETEETSLSSLASNYKDIDLQSIDLIGIESKIQRCSTDKSRIAELDLSSEEKELLESESNVFSKGFSREECDSYINKWDEDRNSIIRTLDNIGLSVSEKEKLERLSSVFKNKQFDENKLEQIKETWQTKRQQKKKEIGDYTLSAYDENELKRLKSLFGKEDMDQSVFEQYSQKAALINSRITTIENLRDRFGEAKESKSRLKIKVLPFIIGLVLMIIGLIASFGSKYIQINGQLLIDYYQNIIIIGYFVLAVGVSLVLFSCLANKSKEEDMGAQKKLKEDIRENEEQNNIDIKELNDFLLKFGKTYDNNASYTIAGIQNDYNSYINLLNRSNEYAVKTEELETEIKEIDRNTSEYLSEYGYVFDESSVMYYLGKIYDNYRDYNALNERSLNAEKKREENNEKLHTIEDECSLYLNKYDINNCDKTKISIFLHDLQNRYEQYVKLQKKKNNEELISLKTEFNTLNKELSEFFMQYLGEKVQTDNYYSRYTQISNDSKDLTRLMDKKAKYTDAVNGYNSVKGEISKYIRSFSFTVESDVKKQLNEMQNHFQAYSDNLSPYLEYRKKKEEFESAHPNYNDLLSFNKTVDTNDIEKLNHEQNTKQEEKNNLQKEMDSEKSNLDNLSEEYNTICDEEGQIINLTIEKGELEKRAELLIKVKDLLAEAKDSLNKKYTAPLNASLSKYLSLIAKNTGLDLAMDVNKKKIIKSNGFSTTENNLSKGYEDIVDICYRFALIDAMYHDEQPIIILDDPFINLDSEKIKNGLELLEQIAKDKQILYLTCHESRNK